MKNLYLILYVFVALACMTAVQSCIKDKIEEHPSTILLNLVSVDKSELDFVVIEDVKNFTITSRFAWQITAKELNGTDGGWYTISAASGDGDDEINVTTKPNPTGAPRTATLTIKGRYNSVEVIISQAKDGDGMLNEGAVTLDDFNVIGAETQTFEITSPFEWTITFKDETVYSNPENPAIDPQWASVDVADGKGEGDKTITVTVKDNKTGDKRIGEFTITAVGKTKIVTVNQMGNLNNTFGAKFLVWCLDPTKGGIDTDDDGSISAEEAEAVTTINCSDLYLGSLKGIENFTKLTELYCYSNSLGTLDVSKNTALTMLGCYANDLTELDVSKNTALTMLGCYANDLTELNVSENKELTYLDCGYNDLTELDVSKNTALTKLGCFNNNLTALDVSENTALTTLNCDNNKLTALDVSKNTALTKLSCQSNPDLAEINISGSSFETLKYFQCTDIASDVEIQVWDGFNPKNLPGRGKWQLPTTTPYYWKVPNLSYAFSTDFLSWCLNTPNNGIDTNSDGSISVAEAEAVTTIDCNFSSLESLKGIENFTKLTTLACYSNGLTTLDVSKNTALTLLDCNNNKLSTLDVSKNTMLTTLDCRNNNLTALDVSENTALTTLYCENNSLSALDMSKNTVLTYLSCGGNKLVTLDVSENTMLTVLACNNNDLTTLDVSKNTALTYLSCYGNSLTALDVSKNTALTYLGCRNNNLTTLDVSKNTALTYLSCDGNSLTALDVSKNTALTTLICQGNSLTTLDVSENTALTELYCSNNNLPTLDVSKNTALTELYCGDNKLAELDVSKNTKLTELSCLRNPDLAKINISGSSFAKLRFFSCNSIASGAEIQVWSGFNIANKPAASDWFYPVGISWKLPSP